MEMPIGTDDKNMNNKALRLLSRTCLLTVAAVLAVAIVPAAHAGGNTVTLGVERIAIPAVPDFENYTDDPKGRQIATLSIESNAQLLSFQASSGPLTRYLIVKVPKEIIAQSMSVREFRHFTAYSRANVKNEKQYGDLATKQAADRLTQLNDALKLRHEIERLKFDAPILMGIDRDDDVAFTHTNLVPMTVTVDGQPSGAMTVMCMSAILVKGKFIIVQLFGPGKEVAWARSTCNKFVADLAAQNK
jgi:hypothetical protein